MNFSATFDVKPVLAAVRRATSLISRSTIPALLHIRLSAKGATLTVGGTNLDCWLDSALEVEQAKGDVLVPGKEFESALALLDAGAQASITMEESRLRLVSGRTRFEFSTMDPADWPTPQMPTRTMAITVPAREFMASLDSLRNAIPTETTRYYLCGVYLDFEGGRMVATNGHILGWEPACWKLQEGDAPKPIILPSDTLNPLKKLLDGADECELVVDLDGQKFTVRHNGQALTTKVIDGVYPPYERIIPRDFQHAFRADRQDIAQSLKRAGSITDGISLAVALKFQDDELTISARNTEGGASEDVCGAKAITGCGAMEVGVASKNLAWAIDSLPASDSVDIQIVDAGTAITVIHSGDDGRRHLRIAMPMRV